MLPKLRAMVCLVFGVLVLFAFGTAKAEEVIVTTSMVKERATPNMTLAQAVVLGVVEGATEYLPVSSTGHLLLTERVMGIGEAESASPQEKQRTKEALDAYTICIQAGAILAVVGLYIRRVKEMLMGMVGKDPAGLRMVCNIAVAFVPAAVIGLLLNNLIKTHLFGPWPVVAAWFAGGLAILAVAWWRKVHGQRPQSGATLGDMNWMMALMIGIAQCIAMWPGVSRSLVTIVGGVMVGLSLPAAVEFSFLLGVVTLGAATSYDAMKHGQVMLQTFDILSLIVGLIVALVSAALSVKWMVAYLNRHGLELFGYYRVALALVVATLIITKVISS